MAGEIAKDGLGRKKRSQAGNDLVGDSDGHHHDGRVNTLSQGGGIIPVVFVQHPNLMPAGGKELAVERPHAPGTAHQQDPSWI